MKALRIEMNGVPEDVRFDDFENWWDRLGDIIGILEGRPEVLQRVCEEQGADWKEICVAWTIFVDPRMRRQDLPSVDCFLKYLVFLSKALTLFAEKFLSK